MPEEVVQDVPSSLWIELCSALEEVYKKLMVVVNSVCKIYEMTFQDLLDAVEQSS